MKTGLKILHKVPDLDKLAEKHQNFDALMDAYADEKARKRKKFYKAGSFALVILATAFLSWLYWGYEPGSADGEKITKEMTSQEKAPVEKILPNEQKPLELVEGPAQKEVVEKDIETTSSKGAAEIAKQEPLKPQTEQRAIEAEREEPEIMATPEVIISETVSRDATPADGLENLYRYLYSEIVLPDSLLKSDDALFLEVGFEIGKTGEISDITFSKELPEQVVEELRRIFVAMPAWRPAMEKGDSVVSVINLPITFQKKKTK